jgi:hypothetical protein
VENIGETFSCSKDRPFASCNDVYVTETIIQGNTELHSQFEVTGKRAMGVLARSQRRFMPTENPLMRARMV